MSHNKTYIALGTNVGNWKNNFNQAISLILREGNILNFSSVYISKPYGYEKQSFFYNSVIELQTRLSPFLLSDKLKIIEKKLQKNKLFKNGPRRIDLDIIFYNRLIISSKKLIIPHYAAHKRDFVLLPIIEITDFYRHPLNKETLKTIYKNLDDKYVFKIKKRHKGSLKFY